MLTSIQIFFGEFLFTKNVSYIYMVCMVVYLNGNLIHPDMYSMFGFMATGRENNGCLSLIILSGFLGYRMAKNLSKMVFKI